MQTIIETSAYLKSADEERLTEKERDAILDLIARNPKAGASHSRHGWCSQAPLGRAWEG
jgi:hypothetical protein